MGRVDGGAFSGARLVQRWDAIPCSRFVTRSSCADIGRDVRVITAAESTGGRQSGSVP